ncbi:MAG: hypothetical protein V4454_18935 [Pseudomonadota bacterium]
MSGARRKKRERFFAKHPFCCFCGGGNPATTEDHIPARGLFLGRYWPEGYVFPACDPCNNSTSKDEFLLAWLVRINVTDYSQAAEKEFDRICRDLQRTSPEIWATLRLHSRAETRRLQRDNNLPAFGLFPGVDIVHSMTVPPEVLLAADRYGVKLAKALHYFHTGKVVPLTGAVKVKVFTNAEAVGAASLNKVLQTLTEKPQIRRAQTTLNGQFDYNYVVVEDGAASAFVVSFGHSTIMVLVVFHDAQRYEESKARRVLDQQVIEDA